MSLPPVAKDHQLRVQKLEELKEDSEDAIKGLMAGTIAFSLFTAATINSKKPLNKMLGAASLLLVGGSIVLSYDLYALRKVVKATIDQGDNIRASTDEVVNDLYDNVFKKNPIPSNFLKNSILMGYVPGLAKELLKG